MPQVKLNRGLDFVQLDDLLIDLKLTPDVLEVPVPRCFIEDRAQVGAAAQCAGNVLRLVGWLKVAAPAAVEGCVRSAATLQFRMPLWTHV